jgi:hypothetical protein
MEMGMADEDIADVFAIPSFWRPSRWLDSTRPSQHEFFEFDIKAANKSPYTNVDDVAVQSDEFFKLPAAFEPSVITGKDGTQDSEPNPTPSRNPGWRAADLFTDAWIKKQDLPSYSAEFKSWDGFALPDLPPVEPIFLTEAGPKAYDAALESPEDPLGSKNHGHNVVESNPYTAALLSLSLGRTSVFFSWQDKSASFIQDLDNIRISGYSTDVLQGLQDQCLECGNISRFLHVFVQIMYKTHPSAGKVALAKAVDSLLLVIQAKLGSQARQIRSLLQLKSLVLPVHSILVYFNSLIKKLSKGKTDEQVLSMLFEETQALEQGDELLSEIMREVLSRVSEPWTDFAQKWIGVKVEEGNPITKDGPGKSFVKVENVAYMDDFGLEIEDPDYVLDQRRMPSFVPEDTGRVMFETGRNLRLLRTHHPDHPLCHADVIQSKKPPSFEWRYDWNSIEQLRNEVAQYEVSLLRCVRERLAGSGRQDNVLRKQRTSHVGYTLQIYGRDESQLAEHLMASIKELNQPLPAVSETDRLSQLLHGRLFGDEQVTEQIGLTLTPHWSLLPLLSFGPLVEAQARLINREYMKLLFSSHMLRHHITLQRNFQLLGNGMFCSRLSHALFDPELETAERQTGIARNGGVMGLRLGGRDDWPPASSELRLALMGVLAESYSPPSQHQTSSKEGHDLPGDLSFAVRDLSDEEIDKCINPGSLEALDFLRLSYKPPAPLIPVITPVILVKYDKIFKLLLRLLRMLYVAGELFRDTNARTSRWENVDSVSLRFRIEAQHFVTSIVTYFFDTGVGIPWMRFEAWLDTVQAGLEDDEDPSPNRIIRVISPDGLREYHEQMLDQIMNTLLLRKRQQPVLKLLEDIFSLILTFSRLSRMKALGKGVSLSQSPGSEPEGSSSSSKELYHAFKKKVDVFITVCRGMSEKGGGHGSSNQTRNDVIMNNDEGKHTGGPKEESNTIDRLLMQLEMSGYYGGSWI